MTTSSSSSSSSSASISSLKSTIWIGNIDTKSSEAQILQLVKPYGNVVKFDFVYTLRDNERIPRGYAFVTYDNYVSADKAIRGLNGLQVLSRTLKVQPASSSNQSSSSAGSKKLPATLSVSLDSSTKNNESQSKESKIKALEAKLNALKRNQEEFKLIPTQPGGGTKKIRSKPYDKKS